MRIFFAVVVLLHGLIHLLGFVGEFSLTKLEGISPSTLPSPWRQILGLSWLLVTLLFLGTFATFLLRSPSWWMLGLPAVVLSQGLILIYWSEAKVGTLANLLMIIPLVFAFGASRFDGKIDREIDELLANAEGSTAVITEAELEALPSPVERWLRRSGVLGAPRARSTRLVQAGLMRTEADGPWMPAAAHQYFSFDPPAFVWRTHVSMMKILPVEGRDLYLDGRGHMFITLGGLVPIVDGRGEQVDQGTLLRFLGEIVWTPSAAVSPFIRWEPMSDSHARATMSFRGISASAVFEFDAEGRQVALSARRYMGSGEDAVLADWRVRSTEWKRFGATEVPSKGEVFWDLPEGEFSYFQWEITDLTYDPRERYPNWRRD